MRNCVICVALCGLSLLAGSAPSIAQDHSGELHLAVADASGAALPAHGTLISQANHFDLSFDTDSAGQFTAKKLPLGNYKLTLEHPGFAPYSTLIEIRSELPTRFAAELSVAPVTQTVNVLDSATLLDTVNVGTSYQWGAVKLREWAAAVPGRQAIDVVQSQPGWLVEANGVLHPRGSEYDTQYVVDGLPVLNNRSPAFAAVDDLEDVQSVKTYTSGIPAEYGRKLGGVIETTTERNPGRGVHGTVLLGGGSFGMVNGYLATSYYDGRNLLGVSLQTARTDRYLDPPIVQNYTNRATLAGVKGSYERDLSRQDRLRFSANFNRSGMQVPNELLQQQNGQRQDRNNREMGGQFAYQHVFSARVMAMVQGRMRDVEARLTSNPLATPIEVFQDRGFREGYFTGTVSAALKHHELKAGLDTIYSDVQEVFSYHITRTEIDGKPIFDPSTPIDFAYRGSGRDREQALFVQDNLHFDHLTVGLGVRFDHYRVVADETAWSPRLGFAWYLPKAGMVVRGSYDRVFGTPAVENLLLSTSAKVRTLNEDVAQLPVRPSRGHYYELGVTKELFRQAHLSLNLFRREIENFADDDTLLNTGVAFPIALKSGMIYGAESRFVLPQFGPVTSWISYSYQVASARFPVVGGLFLGEDAADELNSHSRTWISQDQRHTIHGQVRYQPWSHFWMAMSASCGSGLPVELGDEATASLVDQFGQQVVDRVNLEAGRVRPSLAVNVSAALQLYHKESRTLRLQGDIRNLNDRLNLINFASLFSGTAIGPPREYALRLRYEY